jgi:hypothetical protein
VQDLGAWSANMPNRDDFSPVGDGPDAKRATKPRRARPRLVHQFLVVLTGVDPVVWRRIQVPENYSFWDLHIAIQDAMGWLGYHLHEFRLVDAREQEEVFIGIPTDDDPEDHPVVPGWEVRVSTFFDPDAWHAFPAILRGPSRTAPGTQSPRTSSSPYAHLACSSSGASVRSCGIRTAARCTSETAPY